MKTSLQTPFRFMATLACTLILLVGLSACGTTRKVLNLETTAELKLVASQDVNPTPDGRAAPIVIQVIKLRDARQFRQEDFLNLYEDPQGRLGNDLIEITRLKELAPGESRVETFSLTPEVKFIGILGEFIQYEEADAKAVIPITAHASNDVRVRIEKLNIDVTD